MLKNIRPLLLGLILFLILATSLLLLRAAQPTWVESCEGLPPFKVSVEAAPIEEGRVLSTQDDAGRPSTVDGFLQGRAGFVVPQVSTLRQVEVAFKTDPASGRVCLSYEAAVTLQVAPINIHVRSDVPAGSCGWQEVVAHERRHIALVRQQISQAVTSLMSDLGGSLPNAPIYSATPNAQPQALALEHLAELLAPRISELEARWAAEHRAYIDTTAEGLRLGEVCEGQLSQVRG